MDALNKIASPAPNKRPPIHDFSSDNEPQHEESDADTSRARGPRRRGRNSSASLQKRSTGGKQSVKNEGGREADASHCDEDDEDTDGDLFGNQFSRQPRALKKDAASGVKQDLS